MILVLLGTFPIPFPRPLLAIDELCASGRITEEVIVQNGHTQVDCPHLTLRPFIDPDELLALYDQARLIISHAGTGSLIKGVKLGKPVIAIPRLQKLGEHIDDHQVEILREFTNRGYVLPWSEDTPLAALLDRVKDFVPKPYTSEKQQIVNYLTDYIDSL
jgi:UDP-N-acetylglucosamine transferase subunit ALG13